MIAVYLPLSAFKGRHIYRPTLEAQIAAARALPALLATTTNGDEAALYLDTDLPLTSEQRRTLDRIVAGVDGPAEELLAVKLNLDATVQNHARTLRQAAGKSTTDVDATRDKTKAAIDAATTADEATAIAEAYTGRLIE